MSQLANNVALEQSFNVYLKKSATFDRFEYAGQRARLDTQTENDGGLNTTTKFNIYGGVERDSILQDVPGTTDFSLIMKRVVNDRKKTQLRTCFFHADSRLHCGNGSDRDDPFAWVEIDRYAWSKASGREKSQTSWEAETEAMITMPRQALNSYDIYRVSAGVVDSPDGITAAASIVDVATGKPAGCGDCVQPSGEGIVYAVTTLVAAGSPYLFVNNQSGALESWSEQILSEWTTAGATAVWGRGNMVLIASNGEGEILRSDDQGATRTQVSITEFATNAPNKIDGLHQGYIVVAGDNGFVYASYDGGRTFEVINEGSAGTTTDNLTQIQIDRNNPEIIWAAGASGALIKSENGGETFFAVSAPSANDFLAMWVEDENHLLLLDSAGALYETSDGGATWVAQNTLPSMPVGAITGATIERVDADVYYATATDGATSVTWRNVDGGADGYWFIPENADSYTAAQDMGALATLDSNRVVVGGGDGTATPTFALLT